MNKLVQRLSTMNVGLGAWPVMIIDDFHPSPTSLVEHAGDFSQFMSYDNDFYPGVKRPVDDCLYAQNLERYYGALLPVFDAIKINSLQASTYAIANSEPADLLPIQRVPHYDTADQKQLALVHYLCAPKWGGTAFYRHRSTGIERIDVKNEQRFQQSLDREATTHGLPPAEYINGDTSLFERLEIVDAKFNRAIIYPASLLHSGAIQLQSPDDDDVASMRLTITANLKA